MITEQELNTLADFGKESDGSYCDRSDYSIARVNGGKSNWGLYDFDEVDGKLDLIKELTDFEDLKDTYFLVTYQELKIKK